MGLPITNPDFTNFRIDVLEMGFNTKKIDTMYLEDFLFVSENNLLINHNGSLLRELREIKDLCQGKTRTNTKNNNRNLNNKQKFMAMQQRINNSPTKSQKKEEPKKNPIASGYDFLKNRKPIRIENQEVVKELPKDTPIIMPVLELKSKKSKYWSAAPPEAFIRVTPSTAN